MDQRSRAMLASAAFAAIFVVVQLGAFALVDPFRDAGYQPDVDPDDPTNSLVYLVAILVVTALMLAAFRLDVDRAIRGFIVFASAYVSVYVFQIVVPPVPALPQIAGFHTLALLAAAVLGVLLWVYPEWYVIDTAGVIMGIGAAGLFGITFGILPAIVLLVALAVYDAISVYGTEHMLTLAAGVMDLRVPVVLVVPLSLSYSFRDADMPDPTAEAAEEPGDGTDATAEAASAAVDDEHSTAGTGESTADDPSPLDRDALFVGLGDAIIPAVLAASAAFFLTEVPTIGLGGLAVPVPALAATAGTLVGLVVLLRMVLTGRAHAGLPLLNGGAIGGYLLGALASGLSITQALGLSSLV